MADISQITQGSSYVGSAPIGGAIDVGITINPSALDRLATFTYYRDRDLWQKRQQENAQAAKQIALITAFDPNSPFKEYTEDLKSGIQGIKDFVRNNPNALYFDRDPKGYQELYEKIGNLDIKRKHATVNDVLWNAQKAKIEAIPNRKERDAKMKLLEMSGVDLFKNGIEDAYRQQLSAEPELKSQAYKVPAVPNAQDYTITEKPNEIYITGFQYGDIPRITAASDAIYFGLDRELTEDSPELKNLTPDQRRRAILESQVTGMTRTELDKEAALATDLLNQYKSKKGNISVKDIQPDDLASEPTIGGLVSLAKQYNDTVDKINAAKGLKNPHINLDDGIDGREIIRLQTFAQNPDAFFTELKPQIVSTNTQIEKDRLGAEWERIGLAKAQLDRANTEDLFGADAILRQLASVINKGESAATEISHFTIPGAGTTTKTISPDVFRIADLNALQSFAKIDKDGNTTNVPDAVDYNKKTGQLNIIYYKKKTDDNGAITVETDGNGNPIEDKTKTQSMDEREWIAQKARQFLPNKDIGGINSLISQALNKNNNSLYNIAQLYKNSNANAQAPDVTKTTQTTTGGGGGGSVSVKTYNVVDPKTGKVIFQNVTKEDADKAGAKGYIIK